MFCRAKICVLLMIGGAIAASAASLDGREKNTGFSTDQRMAVPVLKPSETPARLGKGSRSKQVKVQKIKPAAQLPDKVEVNGFIFNRPADATSSSIVPEAAAPRKK